MKNFFSHIRKNRKKIIKEHGDAITFCSALSNGNYAGNLSESALRFLGDAETDHRDYAIASTYALLIGDERRRELSAYFTPPALARAAIEAGSPFIDEIEHPTVLDPACGGGSFLTPIARHLITRKISRGLSPKEACDSTVTDIHGCCQSNANRSPKYARSGSQAAS